MTTTALTAPAPKPALAEGETLPFPIGEDGHTVVAVQCIRLGAAYQVTVYSGSYRVEDNCSSFPTERDARAAARLYAHLYLAEA